MVYDALRMNMHKRPTKESKQETCMRHLYMRSHRKEQRQEKKHHTHKHTCTMKETYRYN